MCCGPVIFTLNGMDSLRDIARFKSEHFVPVLPEGSQVNLSPGAVRPTGRRRSIPDARTPPVR